MDPGTARNLPKGTLVVDPDDPKWVGTWKGVCEDDDAWCWVEYRVFGQAKLTRDRVA